MKPLPIVSDPATDACAGCPAPCCLEHDVDVNGFELVRLMRGLGLPWAALVRVVDETHGLNFGFRLDGRSRYHHFELRRRESGACQFLLELDGGWRRCGVHALRPGACRIYPLRPSDEDPAGAIVGAHAICPPPQRALYQAARASLVPLLQKDDAERALWLRTVARWDEKARAVLPSAALSLDSFVDWVDALYAQLQASAPSQLESAIDAFPV